MRFNPYNYGANPYTGRRRRGLFASEINDEKWENEFEDEDEFQTPEDDIEYEAFDENRDSEDLIDDFEYDSEDEDDMEDFGDNEESESEELDWEDDYDEDNMDDENLDDYEDLDVEDEDLESEDHDDDDEDEPFGEVEPSDEDLKEKEKRAKDNVTAGRRVTASSESKPMSDMDFLADYDKRMAEQKKNTSDEEIEEKEDHICIDGICEAFELAAENIGESDDSCLKAVFEELGIEDADVAADCYESDDGILTLEIAVNDIPTEGIKDTEIAKKLNTTPFVKDGKVVCKDHYGDDSEECDATGSVKSVKAEVDEDSIVFYVDFKVKCKNCEPDEKPKKDKDEEPKESVTASKKMARPKAKRKR